VVKANKVLLAEVLQFNGWHQRDAGMNRLIS
jgi:hypothetical protein